MPIIPPSYYANRVGQAKSLTELTDATTDFWLYVARHLMFLPSTVLKQLTK